MAAVEPFNIPDPATTLTPMQEYLFDLNGYLVLEGAISPDDVGRDERHLRRDRGGRHRREGLVRAGRREQLPAARKG